MAQLGQRMSTAQDVPPPPADHPVSGAGDAESGAAGGVPPAEDELMKQFEKMLSGNLPHSEAETQAPAASASAEGQGEKSFQEAVQATMAKLKQSNASAANKRTSDASNPLGSLGLGGDSDLTQILEALSKAGGEDGEMPDLSQMLTQMMEDLMNKEILYEPLKDLHQRVRARSLTCSSPTTWRRRRRRRSRTPSAGGMWNSMRSWARLSRCSRHQSTVIPIRRRAGASRTSCRSCRRPARRRKSSWATCRRSSRA